MFAVILVICGTSAFASCSSDDDHAAAYPTIQRITERGKLMRKGQDDLLALVNAVIAQMKADGSLRLLHEKYGLVYGYETKE